MQHPIPMNPIRIPILLTCCFSLILGMLNAQHGKEFEADLFLEIKTLYGQGNYEEALPLAKLCAEKAEKAFGVEDSTYALAMTYVGVLAVKLDLFDTAEKAYQAAINARGKVYGKKHQSYAASMTNLAGLYLALGEYEKAEPYYRDAREVFAATLGTEHPNYATTTTNLAYLYTLMGRYELAEKLYIEAIAIRENTLGKRHYLYAVALNNLSLLYHELKEFDKEVELLKEVLDIAAEALGREHPYYADYLNNLAGLYFETKRYIEAEALYKQALDLYKETVGDQHSNYARALSNLSTLYLAAHRYKEAMPLEIKALDIWKKKLGHKHPDLAVAYSNMALLSIHNDKPEDAQRYLNAAFSANSDKEIQAKDLNELFLNLQDCNFLSAPSTIQMCEQLVRIQQTICKKSKDIDAKQQYFEVVDQSLLLTARLSQRFMLDEDRLQLLNFGLPIISAHIHAALDLRAEPGYLERAFWSADKNKSNLLASALDAKQQVNFGGIPDSLLQEESDLKQELDLLNKQLFEAEDADKKGNLRKKIVNLNLDIESFKKELQQKYAKYYAYRFQAEEYEIATLQSLLPDNALMIEYFIEDAFIYAFCVTNKSLKVYEHQVANQDFIKLCEDYRTLISRCEGAEDLSDKKRVAYTTAAYALYEQLLKAPLDANPDLDYLIIVADGMIGQLPFEAFLTEPAKNVKSYAAMPYVLKKYKLSYSYSAKLWMENRQQPIAGRAHDMLAMAATYLAETDKVASTRSGTLRNLRDALKDLPAARAEVESLSKFFKGNFLSGNSATEMAFKSKANDFGVIHLAMHGLIDIKNPMLSSIAFSESSDKAEDNFLQAFEISGLDLKADLVVLSACETGYGRFRQGEGVMSLARSFMYAGVPSLVVSLWQVNDESTSLIMQYFYKNLAKGMDKAKALQQAKLRYLETIDAGSTHPALWAPFVQLGDSRPIKISQKSNATLWYLGFGLAGVGLLAFLFFRKSGERA